MISRRLTIQNKLGLHARAASVFVKTAGAFASDIQVTCEDRSANGKSIMSMMMLEAVVGTSIVIEVDGPDEADTIEALANLVNDRFGEAE